MKFKIRYKLEVNNENYERNYSEENSKHNVYKLTGRNELGKTTTLEVVAYAFGVTKFNPPTVNEYLRKKIEKFDYPNVTLSYDILIETGDMVIQLKSNGKKTDKEYIINNEPYNSEYINNKFVVFFDVPEELYSKLRNLIDNVSTTLNNYILDLNKYKNKLSNMYNELNNFEQSDDKQHKLNEELREIEDQIQNQNKLLNEYTSEKDRKFPEFIIYQYNKLMREFKKCDDEIASIDRRIKEYNPNKTKVKPLKSGDELRGKIYDKKDYFMDYLSSEYPEKQSEFDTLISQLKCLSNPSLLNEQIILSYFNFFKELGTRLDDDIDRYSNQSDVKVKQQELAMIQKLIEIVEEFSDINIEIPGANVKLLDILNPLNTRRDELKELLQKNGNIDTKKSLSNDCNTFIKLLGNVTPEFKEYQKVMENLNSNDGELTVEDITELQRKREILDVKRDNIAIELGNSERDYYNIPEEKRNTSHPQDAIEEEYEALVTKTDTVNRQIQKLNEDQNIKLGRLEGFKKVEKPQISLSLNEINKKIDIIGHALHQIGPYAKFMELFAHSDANNIPDSDPSIPENIGRYLASILGYVYYNHKPHSITNIDFAKKEYILADSTPLSFNFIGRGTSALNSLIAKIEQSVSGKEKIILIDEIGDMDSDNKEKLSKVLKEHSDNKDSILSLLTERNDKDTIEISSL